MRVARGKKVLLVSLFAIGLAGCETDGKPSHRIPAGRWVRIGPTIGAQSVWVGPDLVIGYAWTCPLPPLSGIDGALNPVCRFYGAAPN